MRTLRKAKLSNILNLSYAFFLKTVHSHYSVVINTSRKGKKEVKKDTKEKGQVLLSPFDRWKN